jgi:ribosomal protein S18 acetylase RimI-like enzyme
MFADLALARRIDGAEASLSSDIAAAIVQRGSVPGAFSRAFAGGVAVFTGVDSPMTKVIGAGFDGAPAEGDITALEAEYFAQRASVRAEVSTLADPAFVRALTARGYVLNGFENVLGRAPLSPGQFDNPAGLVIDTAADPRAWMHALIDGFEAPDTGVVSAPGEPFQRDVVESVLADMAGARGFMRYAAVVDGEVAGAGSMRLCDGVAQLCGAATRPAFRRRGVQTAILHARLRHAATAGSDIAVVTTEPGSRSQQNAQRAGFALLYSRAVLIKAPPAADA